MQADKNFKPNTPSARRLKRNIQLQQLVEECPRQVNTRNIKAFKETSQLYLRIQFGQALWSLSALEGSLGCFAHIVLFLKFYYLGWRQTAGKST